jgi:superfamily I DNA/RNA helicase
MPTDVEKQLKDATDKILQSDSRKKLIVAGPGAGKTTIFKLLLQSASGDEETRLVLTFINNLKDDLEEALFGLATVFTLHGYCQSLLHRHGSLRRGLSGDFRCLPGLASLIKTDWKYLKGEPVPRFVEMMRELASGEEANFYEERANYYDAVDFDDSVYRVYQALASELDSVESYDLVLIDEYQDFNRLEAGLIDLLAERNAIVVAGDDDQALYSQLKGASWEFIRSLHEGGKYEVFELPFCMRCPEVIVGAVNDIISVARNASKLKGRIEKPYFHYAPVKGEDSKKYPVIDLITTTVQRLNANYFGRYIEQQIALIPEEEIAEAAAKGEPTVLIIGSKPYLPQVAAYLSSQGLQIEAKQTGEARLSKEQGFEILNEDAASNLGWRLFLEFETPKFAEKQIKDAAQKKARLVDILPDEMKERILNELAAWKEGLEQGTTQTAPNETETQSLRIKLTSFEGAKGLSAQHVFILGMHEGELPRDARRIQDIEICRLLVGLTRTKKKCSILLTRRFGDTWKSPSVFLSWIKEERFRVVKVNAQYWRDN